MTGEKMQAIRKGAGMSVAGMAMRMERSLTAIRRMEAGTLAVPEPVERWLKELDQFVRQQPPPSRLVRYTYWTNRRAEYADEVVGIPDAVAEDPRAWIGRPFPIKRRNGRPTRVVIDYQRPDGGLVLKAP